LAFFSSDKKFLLKYKKDIFFNKSLTAICQKKCAIGVNKGFGAEEILKSTVI